MRLTPSRLAILSTALVGLLGGCKSELGDNSTSTTTQSATGVWSGTDSASGAGVTGIINSTGQAAFIRSDGILFTGTAQVSASNLVMTADVYVAFPSAFNDGSTYGVGTLNGSVTTGATLSGSVSFTTNNDTASMGDWSLSYEALSDNASSTATISGPSPYTDAATGAVIAISSTGVLSGQTNSNGCALNGSVSTLDAAHNIYEVSYTYQGCTGSYATLNGLLMTGLAYLNTNLSPAQVIMAVTASPSVTYQYGIISTLNGS